MVEKKIDAGKYCEVHGDYNIAVDSKVARRVVDGNKQILFSYRSTSGSNLTTVNGYTMIEFVSGCAPCVALKRDAEEFRIKGVNAPNNQEEQILSYLNVIEDTVPKQYSFGHYSLPVEITRDLIIVHINSVGSVPEMVPPLVATAERVFGVRKCARSVA